MTTASTETDALDALRTLTGRDDAVFHDGQLEAIRVLVDDHSRALVVQRTGWGKSAVYFIATLLLRQRGTGPTLLVSPLLALMRDQVAAAARAGVRAVAINSANPHEWEETRAKLAADEVRWPGGSDCGWWKKEWRRGSKSKWPPRRSPASNSKATTQPNRLKQYIARSQGLSAA